MRQNYMFMDQHGEAVWAHSVKELREKCGGGSVKKMYVDKLDGKSYHVGYVIGQRWFTQFMPVERSA